MFEWSLTLLAGDAVPHLHSAVCQIRYAIVPAGDIYSIHILLCVQVVSHFVSAGDVVRLHVLQGAGPVLKEFESLLQSSVKLQRKNTVPVIPDR